MHEPVEQRFMMLQAPGLGMPVLLYELHQKVNGQQTNQTATVRAAFQSRTSEKTPAWKLPGAHRRPGMEASTMRLPIVRPRRQFRSTRGCSGQLLGSGWAVGGQEVRYARCDWLLGEDHVNLGCRTTLRLPQPPAFSPGLFSTS